MPEPLVLCLVSYFIIFALSSVYLMVGKPNNSQLDDTLFFGDEETYDEVFDEERRYK